jgi:hypothetical protein
MDYHWDHLRYPRLPSYHAQTMTHMPLADDSILVHLLVVLAADDSDLLITSTSASSICGFPSTGTLSICLVSCST